MLKPVSNGPIPPASPVKQLILRLAGELARLHDSQPSTLDLIDEARAYLSQPEPEEEEWYSRFADWLEREMPEGTVIGDPLWWASKIADYLARAYLAKPEPEATITEPRGCPTPGACSCPTAPYVPPELIRALELAEAALADISDTEREPWSEARAAQDLPRIRAVLARWGRPVFRQKELTDEQLLKCFKIATPCYNMEDWKRELDGMRAAIAADRALCARLAVEPVPKSPTDEEIDQLSHETWKLRKSTQWAIRTALARWGSPPQ